MILTWKKVAFFVFGAVVLGAMVIYAMKMFATWDFSRFEPVTVEAVAEELGLKLSMTLDKTTFQLGEPVNITISLTNISNQTIQFTPGGARGFDFLVHNDTHNDMYLQSRFAVTDTGVQTTLGPGESISMTRQWRQVCNHVGWGEPELRVTAGTYYIVGKSEIWSPFDIDLQTEPIKITIT